MESERIKELVSEAASRTRSRIQATSQVNAGHATGKRDRVTSKQTEYSSKQCLF